MRRLLEKNVAELLMIVLLVVACSSCGTTNPFHAPGITELNKQYSRPCR